jgi:DNA polymerase-4
VARFPEHIAHVDMDAFFVEVERLHRAELRGVAVVVAGLGGRGVVSSASYEARERGVHSGMPTAHARRLCPHARFVAPDHHAYSAASDEVFAVFASFTPVVEPVSVDEAFLDIAGLHLRYPSPREVGVAIRTTVRRETGLPASAGLATTKLLAKLASRAAKPDGLRLIPAGGEQAFLQPLEVRALWGVGEATYARLEELGVHTVGDLAALPRPTVERRLGAALGGHLHDLANGRDPRPVEPGGPAKSLSVEETYARDLSGEPALEAELLRLADRLASRLRGSGAAARTVALKVRFGDFTTITRSQTLPAPVDTAHELYGAARRLLGRAGVSRGGVRLLGIAGEGLEDSGSPRQLGLEPASWSELEAAVDRVRARFGRSAVGPARLAAPPAAGVPSSQDKAENRPGA